MKERTNIYHSINVFCFSRLNNEINISENKSSKKYITRPRQLVHNLHSIGIYNMFILYIFYLIFILCIFKICKLYYNSHNKNTCALSKEYAAKIPKRWDCEKSIIRAKKNMHAALNTHARAIVLFIIPLFTFGMLLWNEWYIDPLCAAFYELG